MSQTHFKINFKKCLRKFVWLKLATTCAKVCHQELNYALTYATTTCITLCVIGVEGACAGVRQIAETEKFSEGIRLAVLAAEIV